LLDGVRGAGECGSGRDWLSAQGRSAVELAGLLEVPTKSAYQRRPAWSPGTPLGPGAHRRSGYPPASFSRPTFGRDHQDLGGRQLYLPIAVPRRSTAPAPERRCSPSPPAREPRPNRHDRWPLLGRPARLGSEPPAPQGCRRLGLITNHRDRHALVGKRHDPRRYRAVPRTPRSSTPAMALGRRPVGGRSGC
jgi:hypothetical protein